MIACNASGAMSFHYGGTRGYVIELRVVLADGDILVLRRGRERARGRQFEVRTESGKVLRGCLPSYDMPRVKNAAGYYVRDNMDLVDLFIGSEGTLGVITEATLRLLPAPTVMWGVMSFMCDTHPLVDLVHALRQAQHRPVAIEYFDAGALELLRAACANMAALQALPELQPEWKASLYVEIHADHEEEATEALSEVASLFQAAGASDDATWTAMDAVQMQKLKDFRHAVPECVNAQIDVFRRDEPRLTKLGTDMAVPDERLSDVLNLYSEGLSAAGLRAVQFGHIGHNHIHVNILPRTWDEYERGRQLYKAWAQEIVAWGGTISAEHGVGKIKTGLLRAMYGERGIQEMLAVKKIFDPKLVLGPGTLLDVVGKER